jgi:hypothetical protein
MHHEIVKLANRVVLSHIALARARPVLLVQVDARGGARTRVARGAAVFGGLAARAASDRGSGRRKRLLFRRPRGDVVAVDCQRTFLG